MMRGWLSLYLRYPPSYGRVVEDADPYGWVRVRRVSNHITPSEAAAQWRTGDGAPYWRDAQIRPAQIIHVAQIPAAYTPLAP